MASADSVSRLGPPPPRPPTRGALDDAYVYAAGGGEGSSSRSRGGVSGLFRDLSSAATVLRIARSLGELDAASTTDDDVDGDKALDEFFRRLDEVEEAVREDGFVRRGGGGSTTTSVDDEPLVVVVEGLDGSGKTTLTKSLAESIPGGKARGTPPKSTSSVRPIFDKRGGYVARAFYTVSNYFLRVEIEEEARRREMSGSDDAETTTAPPAPVFLVDWWYSSTCAYTVAYKNTTGEPEDSIENLPDSVFRWPPDLRPPDLMILLDVNDDERKRRVSRRKEGGGLGGASLHNPWDDRLSADASLGRRIVAAHRRTIGPGELVVVSADGPPDDVARTARDAVEGLLEARHRPEERFENRPLDWFVRVSASLGLCDGTTGRRKRRAPWAFQLALADGVGGRPSLRTVGIHSVDVDSGMLFFAEGHPGGWSGGDPNRASAVWVGGEYPREQQWRAEGSVVEVTAEERGLKNLDPPTSLVANLTACREMHGGETTETVAQGRRRGDCPDSAAYRSSVTEARRRRAATGEDGSSSSSSSVATAYRFVPTRMEVLVGGPSSPGGPRRYEWVRSVENDGNGGGDDVGESERRRRPGVWTDARPILPFSPCEGARSDS